MTIRHPAWGLLLAMIALVGFYVHLASKQREGEPRQFCHFASGWADSTHTALKCILWWDGKQLVEIP